MPDRTDRVLTLHPEGKQGCRIDGRKYAAMRRALLAVIPARPPGVPFAALADRVRGRLPKSVFGPDDGLAWYTVTVKLDLEARGLVQRVPGVRPQHLVRGPQHR